MLSGDLLVQMDAGLDTPANDQARPVQAGGFERDMARALAVRPRAISPKYFYDAQGSKLFDQICLSKSGLSYRISDFFSHEPK